MIRLLLIALLLGACATGGGSFDPENLPEGSFTVSRAVGEDGFSVPVMVNGAGPFPFLIDTGATISALYPSTVRAARLDADTGVSATVRGLNSVTVNPIMTIEEVRFGEARYEDLRVVVLDHPEHGDPAGVIGLDILRDWALAWDAEEQAFTFIPSDAFDPAPFARFDRVQLERNPYGTDRFGLNFVTAEVFGTEIPALLDSGTTPSVANWEAAAESENLRQLRQELRRKWQVEGANGTFAPRALAQMPDIELGPHTWRRPMLLVVDLTPLEVLGTKGKPLMIVGADMLSVRHFVLHPGTDALYLSRRAVREIEPASQIVPRGAADPSDTKRY